MVNSPSTVTLAFFAFIVAAFALVPSGASAQLLRKSEYGAGITFAIYQYDDVRSKPSAQAGEQMSLKQTTSSPEEEMDHLNRSFGLQGLKLRTRSVGSEGEPSTCRR
jgi:hypothetical protein